MNSIVVKCDRCGQIGSCESNSDLIHRVNNCNGNLVETSLSYDDFWLLCDISDDNDFLQAMIDLKEKDIIEYNLKMSQFKSQLGQQKSNKTQNDNTQNDNTPHCPNCKSVNIKPISALNRGASIAMWGIFSKKINKSFECLNCKYTW